jgi:hypothetical protein
MTPTGSVSWKDPHCYNYQHDPWVSYLKETGLRATTMTLCWSLTWNNPHGHRCCHWDFETVCILAINVVEETIEGLIIIKI